MRISLIIAAVLALSACDQQAVQRMQPTAIDFGDSISVGYSAETRADLYGVVDFRHDAWDKTGIDPASPTYTQVFFDGSHNNGYSSTLLRRLEVALDGKHFNVIVYNSGIHDLQHFPANVGAVNVAPETYRDNLEAAAQEAESHADIVIWVNTTDVDAEDDRVGEFVVDEAGVIEYNGIADAIARSHGFYVLQMPKTDHNGTVHFRWSGSRVLGQALADCVLTALNHEETSDCHS